MIFEKCLIISGLGSINELFRKLKTYTALLSLSGIAKISIPRFSFSKHVLWDLCVRSMMDWFIGKYGIPVECLIPNVLRNCNLCEVQVGPLSVFISWGAPNVEKASRKCFVTSLTFSLLWAEAKIAPENVSMDTCMYLNHPKDGWYLTSTCQADVTSKLFSPGHSSSYWRKGVFVAIWAGVCYHLCLVFVDGKYRH